jgi:hypothetical protein
MADYTELEQQRARTIINQTITYVGNWTPERLGQFKQPSELELMLKQAESVPVGLRTMRYDAVVANLQIAVNRSKNYVLGGE